MWVDAGQPGRPTSDSSGQLSIVLLVELELVELELELLELELLELELDVLESSLVEVVDPTVDDVVGGGTIGVSPSARPRNDAICALVTKSSGQY